MRLRIDQLPGALQKGLAPIYWVSGDEPFQLNEAADTIRRAARDAGYGERQVYDAVEGFDWNQLDGFGANLSLFAEQRLIELRMSGYKREAGKALSAYADDPPADTLMLITGPKLDKRQQSSAWVKALESGGVLVQVWPLDRHRLPAWLQQRAGSLQLQLSDQAAHLLVERAENNVLAAAQELEKLRLIHGEGSVDVDAVLRAVADSARFSVYDFADAALAGDRDRVWRIVHNLREGGTEATLALWSLARELRALAQISTALLHGKSLDVAMREAHVWQSRTRLVELALQRNDDWHSLLCEAALTDAIVKGQRGGDPWAALERLSLRVAGGPAMQVA